MASRSSSFAATVALLATGAVLPSRGALPSIEPVAHWGCAACSGAQLFGAVNAVTVDAAGTVFVLDSYAPMVRRFSAGGDSAAFGSKGQGPGEFRSATSIAVVGNDRIEVFDTRQRRAQRLDFNGKEVSTRALTEFPTADSYAREEHAWYLGIIDFRTFSTEIKRLADGEREPHSLRRVDWPLDAGGEPADFFAFTARPGGGFAIGDGHLEYRIRLYDAAGAAEADISRDVERVAKTDDELRIERERRDAAADRRAQMAAREGGSSARAPSAPPIDPLKRHFYVNALRHDGRGRLWVLTGRGGVDVAVFDLFDASGSYLGELTVPADVARYDIAGEWLVTTGMSAGDFPQVHLWRLIE